MSISSYKPFLFLFLEIFRKEGGIQTYNKDIFREYISLTQLPEADIFLLRDKKPLSNSFARENFRFHYFYSSIPAWGRIWFAISLFSYILIKRPQRVFCGHIKLATLTQLVCQRFNIPYIVMTHGKEVWEPLEEREREALVQAEQIWTVSRHTRDRTCQTNHLDPQKFKLLPCSVDGDYFKPGHKSLNLIQKYNLDSAKVLLTVARLWPGDRYKGVDVTIRALPKILAVYPNVKYLVIGRGDDQKRLASLAQELGISDHVVFAGFVATDQLIDHYRLADGYVMPSQEGFGIVYLEAMACGIPVIAGDHDGSMDPLQDGHLGWHVPHRDQDAVANACIELLKQTDKRCDPQWLRYEALNAFGHLAFRQKLKALLL